MDEQEYWGRLEYRISDEFKQSADDRIRFLWCDGLIPDTFSRDQNFSRITGRAWIGDGPRNQEEWRFELRVRHVIRPQEAWDRLLPHELEHGWLDVDVRGRKLVIDRRSPERECVMNELEAKEAWFDRYTERLDEGDAARVAQGVREPLCPCCGYATLGERGGYEICPICDWEDDGQDDPRAEEVWGGPNGDYSLVEARRNFRAHMTMYRESDMKRFQRETSEARLREKRALMGELRSEG